MKHLFASAALVLLLAGCGSGGADSYYNDSGTTPTQQPPQPVTQVQPVPQVIQVAPTTQPTEPPPPQPIGQPIEGASNTGGAPDHGNSTVMLGDDYAANVAISLGMFCLSPFAFFLYAFAISGAIMRRYGLLPLRGNRNE